MHDSEGHDGALANGWGKLVAAVALAIALDVVAQVAYGPLRQAAGVAPGTWEHTVFKAFHFLCVGVAAMLFIILLGGRELLDVRGRRLREGGDGGIALVALLLIVASSVLVAVACYFGLWDFIGRSFDPSYADVRDDAGNVASGGWAAGLALAALYYFSVGMAEECAFRGLLLQGFLARFGSTRAGLQWACAISSLLFGLMHVGVYVPTDTVDALQMVFKTLETGMFGFVLAAVVVKTRNIWWAVGVHALADFVNEAPAILLGGAGESVFVSGGIEGCISVVMYCLIILVQAPALVYAIRVLLRVRVPDRGAFVGSNQDK